MLGKVVKENAQDVIPNNGDWNVDLNEISCIIAVRTADAARSFPSTRLARRNRLRTGPTITDNASMK